MGVLTFPLPAPHSRAAHLGITAATGLAIVLLVGSAWLARSNLRVTAASDTLTDQVRAAEFAAETLLSTLKDAETGQRGFLLTGDPAYLQPYDNARARLDRDFVRLEAAPLAVPERVDRIRRIRQLAALKLRELGLTVGLFQSGHAAAALAMVRTNQGKDTMDAIRVEVAELQSDAEARLTQTRAHTPSDLAWAWVVGLGALACLLLGGVALTQRRARLHVASSLYRLERFIRAFELTQGMMRGLDGRITFWNSGAERLYGYQREEALGRISHDLLRTGFPEPHEEIEVALLRDGQWQGELVHHRRDGKRLHVVSQWVLHRGEAGEPDVVIEVNTDVTGMQEGEVKLRLALDASAQGIWHWNPGRATETLNCDARCKALFGLSPQAPVNYPAWAALIVDEDRAAAKAALARAIDPADPHDEYDCEYRVAHSDGTVLWLAAMGRALFEPSSAAPAGRRAIQVLGTVRDVSDARKAEQKRQQADALLRTIVQTAPGLIYAKDREGRMVLANPAAIRLIGKPWSEVEGRTDLQFLDDKVQAQAVVTNDQRIMAQGVMEELEELVGGEGVWSRVWYSTKAPLRDTAGAVVGLVGMSVEITDRKEAEARLRLMVDELNHRVKNTLATVQALAARTLRGADPALRQALENRLVALAAAHDVLTRERWTGANLDDVVEAVLATYDGTVAKHFLVSGPSLRLCPRAALALVMALHELVSNALKYGALSVAPGQVEIRWEVVKGTEPMLRLTWTERGGPLVAPPERRGFGVQLIERNMARDLGGAARIDFEDPAGITCRIEAPLPKVAASANVLTFPRVGVMARGERI